VQRGDAVALRRAAHSVKGSVGYVAAGPAAEAAQRLEQLATAGDLTGVGEAVARLEGAIHRLTPALVALAAPGSEGGVGRQGSVVDVPLPATERR
jgi:HPt (histidine-containing phosphotransfer) domain-containing protein